MCLGKLNDGVFAAAMLLAVCVVISPRRLRTVAVFAAGFLAGGVALWLVTGQELGGIADYVRSSAGIISGYSESMGLTEARRHEGVPRVRRVGRDGHRRRGPRRPVDAP